MNIEAVLDVIESGDLTASVVTVADDEPDTEPMLGMEIAVVLPDGGLKPLFGTCGESVDDLHQAVAAAYRVIQGLREGAPPPDAEPILRDIN